jgi:arginine N-succinyltransferase
MLVVRAIRSEDLDGLMNLAGQTGSGMTTLKADRGMLGNRVAVACASFAEEIPPEQRDYLFVMEDTAAEALVGVCAIKSAVGLDEPFYNYRIGTLVHASKELKVFSRMETLYLSNDLTGYSELCSLYLHPDYRQGGNGKLLLKSRLLFIAQFPHLFAEKLFAELRGFLRADGTSPFWDGLGRHFFKMEFERADELTSLGKKTYIAELMPSHPLYIAYLPQEAQDAIGRVHDATAPARRMLEQEGMYYEGYVDIFDAGPVLQARVRELRAMRESALERIVSANAGGDEDCGEKVDKMHGKTPEQIPVLVANTPMQDFRVIAVIAQAEREQLVLSAADQALLHCQSGDSVRTLSMNPMRQSDRE